MDSVILVVAVGAAVAGFVQGLSGFAFGLVAIVARAMLIPSLLGARVYIGISEATFRKVVLSALTASGFALLASSVRALLARG